MWMNGKLVPWASATVHVSTHALHYGSSVFEGMRCYDTPKGPALFRAREHMRRFIDSGRVYRMQMLGLEELIEACKLVVRENGFKDAYLRPLAFRGAGPLGVNGSKLPIDTIIMAMQWGTYLGEGALENGVDTCVSSWHRMAPNTIPSMAKVAGNYLGGQLIKMEALANGFDEAIALGPDGMISEGSGQNVFVVHKGVLFTTPLNGTLLPGITRESIITIAHDAGFEVREQPLQREILYTADEIFLTGTASEVTPVRSVDRLKVGAGRAGEVTKQLQRTFLDLVHGKVDDRHGWLTFVRAERASAT